MYQILIILLLVSSVVTAQDKTDGNYSFLNDTLWAKENLFECKAELISIEKTRLLPCGFLNDWTIGQFRIIEVNNKNIKAGKVYAFYIPCGAGINDIEPNKGKTYLLIGIIKFPEKNSTLDRLNDFKNGNPEIFYLGKIKL